MRIVFLSLIVLLSQPVTASAAVTINEIAWMGSELSANHEWIELYNNGLEAISVAGWQLKDEFNLAILLNGSIAPGEYVVLERTSEDSAPGLAFMLYTGALVNTGTTLTLYDEKTAVMDQVSGGENWQAIGGDNATKETAQYTTKGWQSAVPTPGQINIAAATVVENSPTTTPAVNTSKSTKRANSSATIKLKTLDTVLTLVPTIQSIAYINQPIKMQVKAAGIGESVINSLKYTWNFGDTYTALGKEVTHQYAYPGTYVVTLRAAYARHDTTIRQEITVLPVTLSLTKNTAGDIQLHNDAAYDVDLSGYTIFGHEAVKFPTNSIILPRSTITIAAKRLGSKTSNSSVYVHDQSGKLVASTANVAANRVSKINPDLPAVATELEDYRLPTAVVMPPEETFAFVASSTALAAESIQEPVVPLPLKNATVSDNIPTQNTENTWVYVALLGLFGLAFTALLIVPRQSPATKDHGGEVS